MFEPLNIAAELKKTQLLIQEATSSNDLRRIQEDLAAQHKAVDRIVVDMREIQQPIVETATEIAAQWEKIRETHRDITRVLTERASLIASVSRISIPTIEGQIPLNSLAITSQAIAASYSENPNDIDPELLRDWGTRAGEVFDLDTETAPVDEAERSHQIPRTLEMPYAHGVTILVAALAVLSTAYVAPGLTDEERTLLMGLAQTIIQNLAPCFIKMKS